MQPFELLLKNACYHTLQQANVYLFWINLKMSKHIKIVLIPRKKNKILCHIYRVVVESNFDYFIEQLGPNIINRQQMLTSKGLTSVNHQLFHIDIKYGSMTSTAHKTHQTAIFSGCKNVSAMLPSFSNPLLQFCLLVEDDD